MEDKAPKKSWFQSALWAGPAGAFLVLAWIQPFIRWPLNADLIANPDALVRLERIRQMLEGGGWFAPVLMRVSSNQGQILHWSRPLDALVSLGAWPLSAFMPLQDAILYASMGLSLAAFMLTTGLVFWCVLKGFKAPPWVAGLACVTFVSLSDVVTMYNGAGWPDHHGLMILVFVLSLGFALRMGSSDASRWPWVGFGVAQAFAIWISPESFVVLVGLSAGLVLVWLKDGCCDFAHRCFLSSTVLCGGIVVSLGLEYGLAWPGLVLDRLSLFSLLLVGVMSAVWAGIRTCPKSLNRSALLRAVWVLGLSGVGSALIVGLVPQALSGPMADADTWFVSTWSVMFGDGFERVVWDGWVLIIFAITALLALYTRKPNLCLVLVPILMVSGLLSEFNSPRWIVYGKIVAVMVLVYGVSHVWPKLVALGDGLGAVLLRVSTLSTVVVLPLVLTYIITILEPPLNVVGPVQTPSSSQPCSVQALIPFLDAQPKTRLLSHPNVSPAFLYFSKHDVMSVPIHPNATAVHDSVRIIIGNDDEALKLLKKYGIGLVVMCATGDENIAYGKIENGLYARTLRGEGPSWLLPLKTQVSTFRVFAVQD